MFITVLNKLFPTHAIVNHAGVVEMNRWLVLGVPHLWPFNWNMGVTLHQFIGDDDAPPHNHFRHFLSIGLWGRYKEMVVVDGVESPVVWTAPWFRVWSPGSLMHRIVLVNPGESCWTLCFALVNRDKDKKYKAQYSSKRGGQHGGQ